MLCFMLLLRCCWVFQNQSSPMSGRWGLFSTSYSTTASSTRRSTSSPADRVPVSLFRKLQVQKSGPASKKDVGADAEEETKREVLPSEGQVAFGEGNCGRAVIFIFIFTGTA